MSDETETEKLKAAAFVHPLYAPKDEDTESRMHDFALELGLPTTKPYLKALSAFTVACKTADAKGSELIAFPGDANYYANTGLSYSVATQTRNALKKSGKLALAQKAKAGSAAVYQFSGVDLNGRFKTKVDWPVRVRQPKPGGRSRAKGKELLRNACVRKFGSSYRDAEKRMETLNAFYSAHFLEHEGEIFWGGAQRIFNESRLDRGGRLYGDWQQFNEAQRLQFKLDGEAVVEIDITACFLFIASALEGTPIVHKDPYSQVPWVTDKNKRNLCKRLLSAHLSKEGGLTQFPQGVRGEFDIPKRDKYTDYLNPILDKFPVLRTAKAQGLEIMFRESECILATIEALKEEGIAAYPVHDCLIVKKANKDAAIQVLQAQMYKHFEAVPWMKVSYADGAEELIDPSEANLAD